MFSVPDRLKSYLRKTVSVCSCSSVFTVNYSICSLKFISLLSKFKFRLNFKLKLIPLLDSILFENHPFNCLRYFLSF